MKATASNTVEAGRLVTVFTTSDHAAGTPRGVGLDHDVENAGNRRPEFGQDIEAVLARIERAIAGAMHGLRDRLARRQAVRELRLLGRSRLVDIGIEPDEIERVVDAVITARRNRTTRCERSLRGRFERHAPGLAAGIDGGRGSTPQRGRMNAGAR